MVYYSLIFLTVSLYDYAFGQHYCIILLLEVQFADFFQIACMIFLCSGQLKCIVIFPDCLVLSFVLKIALLLFSDIFTI